MKAKVLISDSLRSINGGKDMFCAKCGFKVSDNSEVCPNCGQKLRKIQAVNREKVVEQAKEKVAATAVQSKTLNEKPLVTTEKKHDEGLIVASNAGNAYMSKTQLSSRLKVESKRQRFYTNDITKETQKSFMDEIAQKMKENHIEAKVEQRTIKWDNSGIAQEIYVIVPETDVLNPLIYLVQFDTVGKYSFVEEKTFIAPPVLPRVPEKRIELGNEVPSIMRSLFRLGLICIAFGILYPSSYYNDNSALKGFAIFLGIVFLVCSGSLLMIITNAETHNAKCKEQEKAWYSAWAKWENSILAHAFQEDVNGRLSRIFDAVFGCIEQVNEAKFGAGALEAEHEKIRLNEIEELVARQRDVNR